MGIQLPPALANILGDYKDALKTEKDNIKELEKIAKGEEKSSGSVSKDTADKLKKSRQTKNALEEQIAKDKIEKDKNRKFSQALGGARDAVNDPANYAKRLIENSITQSKGGKLIAKKVEDVRSAISKSMNKTGALGVKRSTGLGISAAAIGGALYAANFLKKTQTKKFAYLKEKDKTESLMLKESMTAVHGGYLANVLGEIRSAADTIGELAYSEYLNSMRWSEPGEFTHEYDARKYAEEMKQAKINQLVRNIKYGSRYEEFSKLENIYKRNPGGTKQRFRNTLSKTQMLASSIPDAVIYWILGNNQQYTSPSNPLGWSTWTAEEVRRFRFAEEERLGKQSLEERERSEQGYNNLNRLERAVDRADTHERANAVLGMQQDEYTRGLVWQQQ